MLHWSSEWLVILKNILRSAEVGFEYKLMGHPSVIACLLIIIKVNQKLPL